MEKQRIPRADAEVFVKRIAWQMRGVDYMIGGSWLRGADNIGDIDVMVVNPRGDFAQFRFPPCFEISHGGHRVKHGAIRSLQGGTIPAQFWACTPEQRGAMQMFITGPNKLNLKQRAQAKRAGYRLSQYGLFKDGVLLPSATELEIYQQLGFEWIEPEERDAAK
jgi:DNA polymerase (family X)